MITRLRFLMFLITTILTEAHIAWMSGKFIAYIHSPVYSFSLNLAAEIVYQYFRLRLATLKRKGDLSRWLLQAAYHNCVTHRYASWCTTEHTLLQNYVLKKAKLRLCDGNCDLGSNLIFHSTLSRLFRKQNKGTSYTSSYCAKAHLNSMHEFTGKLVWPYAYITEIRKVPMT